MDPATGRFTQEDTYQGNLYDPATLHKYSYANDNPVVYCDPSGYFGDFISAIASVTINCILNNSTAIAYGVGIGALVSGASAFALGKKDISTDSLLGAIIGGMFGALSSIKAVIHLGMLLSMESLSVESANAIQSFADGQKKEGAVHVSLALLAAYGYVSGLTAAFNTSSAYGSKIVDSNYESSNAVKDPGLLEGGSGTTKLYMAMSQAEYDSVIQNQKFVPYDFAMEDKWFATTQENATKWGDIFYPDGNYRILEVEVDTNSLNKMYYVDHLDNIGPAYCSPLDILEESIRSIKEVKR